MSCLEKNLPCTYCLIAFFFVITILSCQALMVEYDLDKLVKESTDIITGKVVEKASHWNKDKTAIVTDITIKIDKAVKGKAEKSITVQYAGGAIPKSDGTGVGMGQSDTPRFDVDEEVFLFLQKEKEIDIFKVTARFQGKFSIIKDKESAKKMIKGAAKMLADPETLEIREVKEYRVQLEDFEAKVKEIIKKQEK